MDVLNNSPSHHLFFEVEVRFVNPLAGELSELLAAGVRTRIPQLLIDFEEMATIFIALSVPVAFLTLCLCRDK